MRVQRRWLRTALALLAGYAAVMILAAAGLMLWSRNQDLEALRRTMEAARPMLALWRLLLYALIVAGWPRLCRWLAPATAAWLAGRRWDVAVCLLLYELLLVQGSLGRLSAWALGLP